MSRVKTKPPTEQLTFIQLSGRIEWKKSDRETCGHLPVKRRRFARLVDSFYLQRGADLRLVLVVVGTMLNYVLLTVPAKREFELSEMALEV